MIPLDKEIMNRVLRTYKLRIEEELDTTAIFPGISAVNYKG